MQTAQKKYAPGTSRSTRSAITLLRQMENDLQRGQRVKELRELSHMTQPAVADAVGVTLRAYQAWEAGGGINWENVKLLAKTLGTSPDFILSGVDKRRTPEPFSNQEGSVDKLGQIERDIADIKTTLGALQGAVLAMTGELLHLRRELSERAEEDPSREHPANES
jgi:transcriptional regulator with XRE-family HTH domain